MLPSEEVAASVRAAMARFGEQVLDPRNFNLVSGRYDYPEAISEIRVLRMAGVKSRTTLSAPYHAEVRAELRKLVMELKRKTGKGKAVREAVRDRALKETREVLLAQALHAATYRIEHLKARLRKHEPVADLDWETLA